MCRVAASQCSALLTSPTMKMPPTSRATATPCDSSMSSTAPRAPRSASARAVAEPMPEAAPVTRATLPTNVDGAELMMLRLRHRHDQADGRQDVPDAHALGLGSDLDHRLACVVNLPRQLPAFLLRAPNGLHELLHDLLEGVAVAVVENRHPGWGDFNIGALDGLAFRSL